MYTGKSSRNPNTPMIFGLIIGIGLIAFGIYLYFDLATWEKSDEEMRLNSLLWLLYDFGGKLTVAGVFSIIGLFSIGNGIKTSSNLRKLKKGVKK